MGMVRYTIHGMNGREACVYDYCFRGLNLGTPYHYLYECAVKEPDVEEWDEDDDMFELIRSNIDFVEYELQSDEVGRADALSEIIAGIPWLREVVNRVDNNRTVCFLVNGQIAGDHMFHALSSLRNVVMHYWSSYEKYRKTYSPPDAFTLLMFSPFTTDWKDQDVYPGYGIGMDYMWANTGSMTRGAVQSVIENGPRWYLGKGCLKYLHEKLPFTPSIIPVDAEDEDSVHWDSSKNCQLFRSFELPLAEDTDPTGFKNAEELIIFAKGLLK